MHGKHHKDKAKIVDYEHLSCGMAVIPDPTTLFVNDRRIKEYSKDLKRMTMKNFTYTGLQSFSRGGEAWN
mgnify:CR=1 FL=1